MLCENGQNSFKHRHREHQIKFSQQRALERHCRREGILPYFLLRHSGSAALKPSPGLRSPSSSPLNVEFGPKASCKHQQPELPLTLQSTCSSPATTFTSDPGTVQLCLGSHFLCMPTPQVPDHLHSRWTAQQLWPEQTSKLVCYPVGWNYTFFNKIWTLALKRGALPSLSFLGYSPLALEYYMRFPYNHSFVGA